MSTPPRPLMVRQPSRVPGGFDTDDDLSPIKTEYIQDDEKRPEDAHRGPQTRSTNNVEEGNSMPQALSEDGRSQLAGEASVLDEKDMRRRLMDMDSSFLPEVSPAAQNNKSGMDDTFIFGEHRPKSSTAAKLPDTEREHKQSEYDDANEEFVADDTNPELPTTPPELYQTPAPGLGYSADPDDGDINTSSLETMSSSPTAAAAARTISRAVSNASIDGYETADDKRRIRTPETEVQTSAADQESTPRKPLLSSTSSPTASPTPKKPPVLHDTEEATNGDVDDAQFDSPRSRKRPKHLNSRVNSQRSSYSSYTTTSTEGGSDVTVGADFALQSGGAAPYGGSLSSRPTRNLSRTISLGSMASGVSNLSDGEDRIRAVSGGVDGILDTLNEEDDAATRRTRSGSRDGDPAGPETPVGTSRALNTPTETVISRHVRDLKVPATVARGFRDRPMSPEKRNGTGSRGGKNLTLKEQSSTIDKLVKENWDLKLKIKFLDDNLNRRSEEGMIQAISENVEMRSLKFTLQKEIRELKRDKRELGRQLKEKAEELAKHLKSARTEAPQGVPGPEELLDMEDELTYLRDRVTSYEVEVETMRHESSKQEDEKRRLAEMVETVRRKGGRGGSDIGAREEIDMWRDLHEAETARREQADEDNRKLREEIRRLKSDSSSRTTNNHATNVYQVQRRQQISSTSSQSGISDRAIDLNGISSAASSTLVEQLRHENAELRSQLGAQTSMLTSRNREKDRLYAEIEELKLGSRSVTGDSILERSASRAHGPPTSRGSDVTRATQLSDEEREEYENNIEGLRDENAALKIEIHDIKVQTDKLLDELEQVDAIKADHNNLQQQYDNDMGVATQDLQALQRERDDALKLQEDADAELEDLKAEAQDRINALEDELEQKDQELQDLRNELSNRAEESDALRAEVRSMSERILRIGDDMKAKLKIIEDQEIEIEAINRETDAIDKERNEEKSKNARFMVQQESSQNEIAFLREEQDGDKIRIGNLESEIANLQASLDSEKARAKDLDSTLTDERHQREVIGSKEKKEVQVMINDLNRELSSVKDEARSLKQNLQSSEIEVNTYKERLTELESNLREALDDPNGTRSTFLTSITKIQKELHITSSDLDITRTRLDEKERLLRNRDALLESHGLESKKLAELLERERQGRRADKAQHEQWQKTNQHISRTVSQKDQRISELETKTQSDRKRLAALEQQFKEQLADRNSLLLNLWNRLSSMCGPDWQKSNNLINGHVITLTIVSDMLPGFSKNLLQAVGNIEGLLVGLKGRVQKVERDLHKEYQALEQNLESRLKKLDRLENIVQSNRVTGTFSAAPEIAKLRGENRLLKSELAVLQKQEMHARSSKRSVSGSMAGSTAEIYASQRAAPPPTLARHHSSSAVETLERASSSKTSPSTTTSMIPLGLPIEPSQQRWIHRLRELERRLKAEREARLLDRSGARKRLEEGRIENEELKMELERERVRRGEGRVGSSGSK